MVRRFVAPLIALIAIGLFTYVVVSKPSASASPQELTVISQTKGAEVLTAQVVDNEVKIKLKNNHQDTITGFAISLNGTTIKVDFAQSGVNVGIEPGDTLEESYPLSPSPTGEPPTLHLLTVLLKNGARDGNVKVAREMEDVRLGEKIQILRTLRILEKQGKDLKTIKSDIEAALNAGELETLSTLKELQPTRNDSKLSDHVRNGLQWGRETLQHRLEAIEQLPSESQEHALIRLKERSQFVLAKL
ncbi:MAG TPA: hypothetical protein VFY67_04395 [Pyrinomonadaceae bacterium]|nr:hypothetical protein [Pyrinomonadaceae bacterium]